jgi:hypothetical protein
VTTTTTVPETIRPLRADDAAAVVRLSLAA